MSFVVFLEYFPNEDLYAIFLCLMIGVSPFIDIITCIIRGLTEVQVQSASGVLSLMNKSQHSRMIGETKMNKSSSRSHCLFTIQVHGKVALLDGDGDMEFNGKLHMVDLAGSECAKSAMNDKGAPDAVARERERMNINRSLLTLGRVITILKEKSLGKNGNARIPYR